MERESGRTPVAPHSQPLPAAFVLTDLLRAVQRNGTPANRLAACVRACETATSKTVRTSTGVPRHVTPSPLRSSPRAQSTTTSSPQASSTQFPGARPEDARGRSFSAGSPRGATPVRKTQGLQLQRSCPRTRFSSRIVGRCFGGQLSCRKRFSSAHRRSTYGGEIEKIDGRVVVGSLRSRTAERLAPPTHAFPGNAVTVSVLRLLW